jgi:hypothetical protein
MPRSLLCARVHRQHHALEIEGRVWPRLGLGAIEGPGPLARPEARPAFAITRQPQCPFLNHFCRRCGNFAMFAAIRRASSLVSNLAAVRRSGSFDNKCTRVAVRQRHARRSSSAVGRQSKARGSDEARTSACVCPSLPGKIIACGNSSPCVNQTQRGWAWALLWPTCCPVQHREG